MQMRSKVKISINLTTDDLPTQTWWQGLRFDTPFFLHVPTLVQPGDKTQDDQWQNNIPVLNVH